MYLQVRNKQTDDYQFVNVGESRPTDREWRQILKTIEKMGWEAVQMREIYGPDELVHWDQEEGWYTWDSIRRQASRIRNSEY